MSRSFIILSLLVGFISLDRALGAVELEAPTQHVQRHQHDGGLRCEKPVSTHASR